MRRLLPVFAVLIVGLMLAIVALVGAEETDQPGVIIAQDGPGLPDANGASVLDYVINQNPYVEWKTWPADRWTDFSGVIQSGAPHGETVRIFVNDIALDAAAAEFDGVLPYGSIVVKENYGGTVDEPGDVMALTIMYKVEGYNPDAGDWFWIKANGDGSAIDAEGMVEGCIGCHSQDGNADFMLRYAFGEEPATYYGDPLPEADGAAVIDYMLNTSSYTEWGSWPATEDDDFSGYLASDAPHGETVRIFVNDRALDALDYTHFDGVLPYGSIVVKENYGGTVDEPGDVVALTIMYKVEGYNPDAGDWFWIKASGDGGTVDAEGMVEGCIGCHSQDGNSDYLLRYDLPEAAGMMGDEGMGAGDMAIDAEALINERCTQCHTRDRVDAAEYDAATWQATIERMVSKGAVLNEEEIAALVEYLSQ
ncbi:MAG: cytochrome P460 family protein [Anaerolineae bacterium]|nr:cytochrome P460 family protein [Anaerolineae bacterium]